MTKSELRKVYLQKRKALPKNQHALWSQQIAAQVVRLLDEKHRYIHLFQPIIAQAEVDLSPIVSDLWLLGKQLILPRVEENNTLSHHNWTPDTLFSSNRWGIAEPVGENLVNPKLLDVILLPLLAVDREGYRVGYGKGFYDRFLTDCREDVVRIGVGFFPPVAKIMDRQSHDIPLDIYVTPEKMWEF